MSERNERGIATVQAKAICAWLDGLTRNDNPYVVSTPLGKRWAKVWLQAFNAASHGVCCDACHKWLNHDKGYHYVYSNGFNYFLCINCKITDIDVKVAR